MQLISIHLIYFSKNLAKTRERIRQRERPLVSTTTIAAGKQERNMMKVAPTSPLPTRHVRILFHRTCLEHSIITTNSPKSLNYKRGTHFTRRSRTIAQAHTHSKIQTKMAENKAIEEAQSKFRSEFLQVLRSRRPAQGIKIKVHSLTPLISLCIAQRVNKSFN